MKSGANNTLNLKRILKKTLGTILSNVTGSTATIMGRYQLICCEAVFFIPVRKQQAEFYIVNTEDNAVIMRPKRTRAILRSNKILYIFFRFTFLS